ncbi:tyrosine-type recombinase/integrase [Alcaligenaceae bacterium SJ-26]|nr:tyrosine-type recombinase/integrase [Alcaligenaceae bacterium SJ-26]
MATNKLTDRAIKSAKPQDKEYELTDGGGLALRIKVDGAKIWAIRYTSPSTGKRVREYIGSYPDISLADAREALSVRRSLVAKDIDPARAEALLDAGGVDEVPSTVNALFLIWYERYVQTNRSSQDDQKAIRSRYEKYVQPKVGDIPLEKVRRGQVMQSIDMARNAGAMRTANMILGELRQMFRYAVAREWMQGDPTAAITRKDAGGQEAEGERILSDDEIVLLRDILGRDPEVKSRYYVSRKRVLPVRTELAMWWTLATAARAVEVATMQHSLVRRADRVWLIPAEVAKNSEAHTVHLSDFALAVWDRLEKLAGPDYVFQGRGKAGYMSEKEVTRRLTDRQTRPGAPKGRKNSTDLDLPGGRWTQHDLRRTAATIMGEAGISPDVIDRCLNHKDPRKVTRTYQRQKMLPQRREAFDALGAHLVKLLGAPDQWLPSAD